MTAAPPRPHLRTGDSGPARTTGATRDTVGGCFLAADDSLYSPPHTPNLAFVNDKATWPLIIALPFQPSLFLLTMGAADDEPQPEAETPSKEATAKSLKSVPAPPAETTLKDEDNVLQGTLERMQQVPPCLCRARPQDATGVPAACSCAQASKSIVVSSRIFLAGKLAEGRSADAFTYTHEQALAGSGASGLLLLMPSGWAEVVEGPTLVLQSLLRKLLSDGSCEAVKVIGLSEDVAPVFSYWSTAHVDVQRNNFVEIDPKKKEDALAALLADTQIGADRTHATAHARPAALPSRRLAGVFPFGEMEMPRLGERRPPRGRERMTARVRWATPPCTTRACLTAQAFSSWGARWAS